MPQPTLTMCGECGGTSAMMSSRICSARSGGVAPFWMERISRSTAVSLEKSTVKSGATRKTLMGMRSLMVPILAWMVMVFVVISTCAWYRP